jgi:hypothetical protein
MGKLSILDVVRALESLVNIKDPDKVNSVVLDLLNRIYRYNGIENEI